MMVVSVTLAGLFPHALGKFRQPVVRGWRVCLTRGGGSLRRRGIGLTSTVGCGHVCLINRTSVRRVSEGVC